MQTIGKRRYGRRIGQGVPGAFHWIIPDRLAGTCNPTYQELKTYGQMGFNLIVCLQTGENGDDPFYKKEEAEALGFEVKQIPIIDHTPPKKEQFDEFVHIMCQNPDKKVLVHCFGGQGRTGSILAVYVGAEEHLKGDEAIEKIKEIWIKYIGRSQRNDVKKYVDAEHKKNKNTPKLKEDRPR
jgi:protein-tyrosine phosphatase